MSIHLKFKVPGASDKLSFLTLPADLHCVARTML